MANQTTDVDLSGRKIREYQLLRRIGVGGMGVVYEGLHPVIGKRVAVKFLLSSLSNDKDLVERFKAEARSVNEIGHRGIVDIFDFGVLEDGTQYFVMELLDGRALDRVIASDAPLHPAIAVRYLEEIVDALAAAHVAGVIHRDIKPSNVFLVETGRARPYIKLLDFGIAKMNAPKTGSTPQTRQSVVIGTPEYIAPEQAQGRSIGAATDLYAVGCMAYEMLTGKLPFRGENPLDTMFKHVTEPTPRVSALVPGTPQQLDDLVFQLMQKKPEDRPVSAEEVLKRLELTRGALTNDFGQPAMSPPPPRVPVTGAFDPDALAHTVQSVKSIKVVQPEPASALPGGPDTACAVAAVQRSPLARWVALGTILLAVAAVGIFFATRPPAESLLVEPPPPKPPEARVEPPPLPPPPLAVVTPPPVATIDAGVATTPVKKSLTNAQLSARIASLERKLEQRESARGEVNKVFRSFLKQAKDDTGRAKTDADRRQVWAFLDDLSKQLER